MRLRLAMTLLGTVLLAPDGGVGGPVPGPGGGAPSAPSAPAAAPAAPAPAPAAQPAAPSQPSGAAPSSEPSIPQTSTQIGDIPSDILALFEGTHFQAPSGPSTPEPVQPQPGQT